MTGSSRIIAAAGLAAALAIAQGCTPTTCNPACPAGQVCDASANICVPESGGCQSNADCQGTNAICDTATGNCVACLADTDCASGQCQQATHTCTPVQCRADTDCMSMSGAPFCSASGKCVQCRTDIDCFPKNGVRQTCDAGTHQCVQNPCQTDQDCSLDPTGAMFCDTTSGGCVLCTSDQQCTDPSKPHCAPDIHACAVCGADSDCDATLGQTCTPDTHVCKVTKCTADSQCDGAERCDLTSGHCVACLQDNDCYFGGVCSNETCVEPGSCLTDADCVFGSFCVNKACVACRSASDCGTGQTCSTSGTCQEPAMCQSASQCLSGRTCTMGACAADATCTPDSGEPNNTADQATPITAAPNVSLMANICPNDVDYYVVTFPEGAGGSFTVKSDASLPPLSLDLYAGPGSPPLHVAGTVTSPGVITAQIQAAPAGTNALLIKVAGGQGQSVAYELDSTVQIGGLCMPAMPPDTTLAEAPLVMDGTYSGSLCPNEQHWLSLNVPADNRLTVALTSNAPAQGIAVEIHTMENGNLTTDYGETDSSGAVSATSSIVNPTDPQQFWVQIYNLNPTMYTYSANVSFIPQAPPNNQCANATVLSTSATNVGHLQGAVHTLNDACGGSGGDSFWLLKVTQPSQVELDLSAGFPAALSLMGACDGSDELSCSTAASGSQSLKFQGLPTGKYYVRVAGQNPGDAGDYSLIAQVSPAEPPVNATCGSPIPLTFSTTGGSGNPQATASGNVALSTNGVMSSCGQAGGDAVYSLTVTTDQQVVANLSGFPGAAISLVPMGSCTIPGTGLCSAADATGSATLVQNVVHPGTYALIVDGGTAVAGQFSLSVTLNPPLYPPPNNTCVSPTDIGDGSYMGTTIGAVDSFDPPSPMCTDGMKSGSVVYHMSVAGADEQITLQLDATFDAAMTVTAGACGMNSVVDCSNGDHERLVLPDVPAGDYYVWIDGYDTGDGSFTLTKSSAPAQPPPTNTTCDTAQAVDLSSGQASLSGSTLRATSNFAPNDCTEAMSSTPLATAGPDVVYSVSIPGGKTLNATLDPTDFDGALYVVSSCSDNTCLAASDQSFLAGGQETVQVTNPGATTETVFVVVGSWTADAKGDFTLQMQLQ